MFVKLVKLLSARNTNLQRMHIAKDIQRIFETRQDEWCTLPCMRYVDLIR